MATNLNCNNCHAVESPTPDQRVSTDASPSTMWGEVGDCLFSESHSLQTVVNVVPMPRHAYY